MIFLDSSKIEEIEKYFEMGIIKGVTTNPTIMVKDGYKTYDEIKARTVQIAKLVRGFPVSVEVLTNDFAKMSLQAKEIAEWAPNINIKIPFHGPNGELDNLKIIKQLTEYGIEVNCTAMMSAQQCLAASMAGARYVSLFGGRINDMGYNCIDEIKKTRYVLDVYDLASELILGSVREPLNIIEWIIAGADIITVPPKVLENALIHARTKETVQMFLKDAEKLKGAKSDGKRQ